MTFSRPIVWALAVLLLAIPGAAAAGPILRDGFGRPIEGRALTLVDWEGQIANPAIRFSIAPPPGARLPARVVLRGSSSRLYFDLPSTIGPDGPLKEVVFEAEGAASVSVSIFPDRDGRDEDHAIAVEFADASGDRSRATLPIRVIDRDRDRPADFPIVVDFSRDRTGFFGSEAHRAAVGRAARDWSEFLDGRGLDPVAQGAETTPIWGPDGFRSTRVVSNPGPFRGFLLYAYGIDAPLLRSGGEPSDVGGFQSVGGARLPIRRSGGYEAEIKGNYNRKGWLADLPDADWWRASNLGGEANDLESIAHHEIGHALVFNPANHRFSAAKASGKLADPGLEAYLGRAPAVDRADHLHGTIDPASLRGAFGFEYHGLMPKGRWLITKADLLAARAVGYPVRATSALGPPSIDPAPLPEGAVSTLYRATLRASGGIPDYDWEVIEGNLPPGLALDRFSGAIEGKPGRVGEFEFTIRLRDQDLRAPGPTRRFRVEIGPD